MNSQIYVLLAPGFEETDVSTITRTLRRLGFSIALVGLVAGPVRGAYGLSLVPDLALSEVETKYPQAVILPGGIQAVRHLTADPRLHTMVRKVIDNMGYLVAIDTAYIILQSTGLLARSEPPCDAQSELEPGKNSGSRWGDLSPNLRNVTAPSATVQLLMGGQVIFVRDSCASLEAVLTLVSLLESSPAAKRLHR